MVEQHHIPFFKNQQQQEEEPTKLMEVLRRNWNVQIQSSSLKHPAWNHI